MLSISSRSPSSRIDYIKLVTRLRCEFSEAQTTLTDTLIVFLLQPPLNSSTSVDNSRSGNFHLSKTMRMRVNKSYLFLLNLNSYKRFLLLYKGRYDISLKMYQKIMLINIKTHDTKNVQSITNFEFYQGNKIIILKYWCYNKKIKYF